MASRRREPKKRHIWKTFYLESGRDYHEIESVWTSWPQSKPAHQMIFEGGGIIQTNVPIAELRDIFSYAEVRWVDYTSATERV